MKYEEPWALIDDNTPHGVMLLLGWHNPKWPDQWERAIGEASWTWRYAERTGISRHHRATHWKHLPSSPVNHQS